MPTWVTTGLIPVRFSGGNPTLHLYVTSFTRQPQTVRYQVNWVQPEGGKAPIHQGALHVGPRRATSIQFDDVQGRTVEVNLNLPQASIRPTVALIGTFLADGAEEVLAFVSPREFVVRGVPETRGPSRAESDRLRVVASTHMVARGARMRRG